MTNIKLKKEYTKFFVNKELLNLARMEEKVPNGLEEIPYEAFTKACKNIQNKGRKYQFFKNAGQSLLLAF